MRIVTVVIAASLAALHPRAHAHAQPGDPPASPAPATQPSAEPAPAPAPEPTPEPEAPPAPEDSFDGAPAPRSASGVRVPRDTSHQRWRVVPRTVLYPVRGAWWLVWSVPRLGAWAYDRYQLKDRFRQIFFNDTETVGLFPTAFVEAGFGLNIGARLVTDDLFGHEEKFTIRAGYGGRFRQRYSAKLSTGDLLGDTVEIDIIGKFELYSNARFFGIGNGDLDEDFTPGGGLIDPTADDTAVATRFKHDDYSVETGVTGHITDNLYIRASGELRDRTFDRDADEGHDEELVDVYDTTRLAGFDGGLRNIYAEIELGYDTRRVNRFYLSPAAPSTGWKVAGFAGFQQELEDGVDDHTRWGVDVQRLFDLYAGDRVLVLRAYVEGVAGDLDKISFIDLPRLGGPLFLRGYDRDRFRDRNVTLFTVEYDYPVERNFGGYVFVDAGRTWRELEDFEVDDFRVGFGIGMQAHSVNGFLTRVFVASSIDGGFIFNLSFDPVFDTRSREDSP